MKICSFMVMILMTYSIAFGANVVVLTSLPEDQTATTNKINKIVKKKFKKILTPEDSLIVINKADQEDLYNALNSYDTKALFWLSHGGFKQVEGESGIRPTSLLLDHNKDNVAKVFKKIHPNIKFLGVIGCNSAQILDEHLSAGMNVGSYIPTKKVVATWAMRKAIRKYKKYLKNNSRLDSVDPIEKGFKIKIKRFVEKESKSLKVFAGKKLIGLIPKASAFEFQEVNFYIPASIESKREAKIVFESGQSAFDSDDHFGEIKIENNLNATWKLFSRVDGTPFGTNERIFLYKSQLEDLGEEENYYLFNSQSNNRDNKL